MVNVNRKRDPKILWTSELLTSDTEKKLFDIIS
jgi:hypothetical protein